MPKGDAHGPQPQHTDAARNPGGKPKMAVRHEVENLIRRGNIFYWRPRVPRTFSRCSSDARLSLSLNASDHRKAQYLARRLNTLLAELKHGPAAGMTTKEQLAKLFAAERDAMHEHLDDVALMSRRNGRADDITDVEMDLENGYAASRAGEGD